MSTVQQFELLKKSAVTQIQDDLEAAVEADRIAAEQAAAAAAQSALDASFATIQDLGSISGTVVIDLSAGELIKATIVGAGVTLSFSGLPPAGQELAFSMRLSGLLPINLPANTKYANAQVPTPAGTLYEIPCSIDSAGNLVVYGVINEIETV